MLPKQYRMERQEIKRILRVGKRIDSKGFVVRAWYDDGLKNNKYAFVISTKVDGRAVVRNKIRRKFRAALMHLEFSEKRLKSGSYIFLIKDPYLATLKSTEIARLIQAI